MTDDRIRSVIATEAKSIVAERYRKYPKVRNAVSDSARPMNSPRSTELISPRVMKRSTLLDCAPKAKRMPISRLRCRMESDGRCGESKFQNVSRRSRAARMVQAKTGNNCDAMKNDAKTMPVLPPKYRCSRAQQRSCPEQSECVTRRGWRPVHPACLPLRMPDEHASPPQLPRTQLIWTVWKSRQPECRKTAGNRQSDTPR